MNADGSKQKNLTNDPAQDQGPLWSPDARKIVFVRYVGNNPDIYTMNLDGSGQKRLTNNPAHDGSPSWSPFPPRETEGEQKGNSGDSEASS
jgi:TolB protein